MTDPNSWGDRLSWLDEVDHRLALFRSSIPAPLHRVAHAVASLRARTTDFENGAESFVGRDTIAEITRLGRDSLPFGDELLVALHSEVATGRTIGRGRTPVFVLRYHGDLDDVDGLPESSDGLPGRESVDVDRLADIAERFAARKEKKTDGLPGRESVTDDGLPESPDGLPGRVTTTEGGGDGLTDVRRPTIEEVHDFVDEVGRRVGLELDPDHERLALQSRRLLAGGWDAYDLPETVFDDLPKNVRNPTSFIAGRLKKKVRTDRASQPKTAAELRREVESRVRNGSLPSGWAETIPAAQSFAEWLDEFTRGDFRNLLADMDDELRSSDCPDVDEPGPPSVFGADEVASFERLLARRKETA